MSTVKITESILTDIANAIRTKKNVNTKFSPVEMPTAIETIQPESHLPITVNITQSDHQTITVIPSSMGFSNKTTSGTISIANNVTMNATVTPDEGYNAGTLNQSAANVNWGDTVSFNATPATLKTFTVTIDNSKSAQLITVTYKGTNYTTSFTAYYGDTISCSIELIDTENFKAAGELNFTTTTVTSDLTIQATNPSINEYILNCSAFISGVAGTYPGNNMSNTLRFYTENGVNISNSITSNWMSIRGYSNDSSNIGNYMANSFSIQSDQVYHSNFSDLGIANSISVDSNTSDGYLDSSSENTGYIHVTNDVFNPIIIRHLYGIDLAYIESNSTNPEYMLNGFNFGTNQLIDPSNSDDTTMFLFYNQQFTPYTNNAEVLIQHHVYNPYVASTNIINRYIVDFVYEDAVTGELYSNNSGKLQESNSNRQYNYLADGHVYDVEIFDLKLFNVEDNDSFEYYYNQLSLKAYQDGLESSFFDTYDGTHSKIKRDIAIANFRPLIYREFIDRMYSYISNPELTNTPIEFKLIFR